MVAVHHPTHSCLMLVCEHIDGLALCVLPTWFQFVLYDRMYALHTRMGIFLFEEIAVCVCFYLLILFHSCVTFKSEQGKAVVRLN